mgnify:CR=1 FL=1
MMARDADSAKINYTEAQLVALTKNLGRKGPTANVVRRLVEDLQAARWRVVELEAENEQLRAVRQRALIVVETDGYGQVYADEGVSVKVLTMLPWQDSHELMLDDKSHWSEIWYPGFVRTTFRPHYLAEPNGISIEALSNVLKWHTNIELLSELRKVEANLP